jgi:PPOX class probable F420-dependent enzyme
MTDEEIWDFLTAGSRTAVFASIRADGRPHAVPTWYAVDGRELVFTTWHETIKAANLRRDPRATMVVQDPAPPYDYVSIEGEAELIDDLDECRRIATRLGAKYMGEDRAKAFGERNGVEGELVVRIRPTRIFGHMEVAA